MGSLSSGLVLLLVISITLAGFSPTVFAQGVGNDVGTPTKVPDFFSQLRFWIEDRLEQVNPDFRTQFGESEKRNILDDLDNGFSVAQERIDRVRERLGDNAVDRIVDANELNKIHEEFLEIRDIEDKEQQRIRASKLQGEVNSLLIVQQGCERPINVMDIVETQDYYEKLRTDYCSKTLKDIDKEQAIDILNRSEKTISMTVDEGETCPAGTVMIVGNICVEKRTDENMEDIVCDDGEKNIFGHCFSHDAEPLVNDNSQ